MPKWPDLEHIKSLQDEVNDNLKSLFHILNTYKYSHRKWLCLQNIVITILAFIGGHTS